MESRPGFDQPGLHHVDVAGSFLSFLFLLSLLPSSVLDSVLYPWPADNNGASHLACVFLSFWPPPR